MRTFLLLWIALQITTFGYGQTNNAKPLVLGLTEQIHSEILNEDRILNIYLPEGYQQDDTTHYAVIYLLDGGIDEDFIHITGLVQFNTFSWVNKLHPSIVVGIANTDRKHDLTFPTHIQKHEELWPTTGGSTHFISFIEKELQPYISQHYRTTPSKTLVGQSLAGLLATEILFRKPALFNKYIIVSPSLWWDNGSLLKEHPLFTDKQFTQPTDIYIAVGKEGLAPTDEPHVMEVDANLLYDKIKAGHRPNIRVHFNYMPGKDHATIYHQAVSDAFEQFAQWDDR